MANGDLPPPPPGFTRNPPPGSKPPTSGDQGGISITAKPAPSDLPAPPAGFTRNAPAKTIPSPTDDTADAADDDSGWKGWVGAAERPLMPLAAGGMAGAAIGGPAGAVIGAGAAGLTETALGLYNLAAPHLGLPRTVTPQDATDWLLDKIGIGKPTTAGQKMFEAGVGAAANVATGAGAAREVASALTPGSRAARTAETLARRPVRQAAGAAIGGEAGQAARESGLPIISEPIPSTLISLALGGAIPERIGETILPGRPSAAATRAHDAGYVLHPGEISTGEEGAAATGLAAVGGKQKTWQSAQHRNMEVTDNIARQDLGLAEGTPLNENTYAQIRREEGGVYDEVRRSVPEIHTGTPVTTDTQVPHGDPRMGTGATRLDRTTERNLDPQWRTDIENLGHIDEAARRRFPDIVSNPEIETLRRTLLDADHFTPDEALGLIKELRFNAKANFLAREDPQKLALAIAQRQAADAVEGLMERQIPQRVNDPTIIDRWRAARQRIAKSWDYEYATTGDHIDPRRLANLSRLSVRGTRRRMLTGGAAQIVDAHTNFPRNVRLPLGPQEGFSVLDMAFSVAHLGHPAMLAPLMRPIARATALSPGFQGYQFRVGRALDLEPTAGSVSRWLPRAALIGQGGSLYPYVDGDTGYDALLQGDQQ
jgi:hypothetical protein